MCARLIPARKVVCFVITASLGFSSVEAAARPGPEVLELHRQAQVAMSEGHVPAGGVASQRAAERLRDAGELFAKAARLLPESPENRQDRGDLLDQAVSAFGESYRCWPENPAPLERALTMVERHINELTRRYGDPDATVLVEWTNAQAHAQALRLRLAVHRAAHPEPEGVAPEPVVEPPKPPAPQKVVKLKPPVPQQVMKPKPPAPVSVVAMQGAADSRGSAGKADWRKVGLGVSAGFLGVAVAAVLGTSLQIVRTPFKGRLYREIEAAAEAHGLPHSIDDDMCVGPGRSVGAVVSACDVRDRYAGAAVGMTVVSVVLAATTVGFAVLVARGQAPRAAALRRHAAGVAVAPQRGGALLTLGGHF